MNSSRNIYSNIRLDHSEIANLDGFSIDLHQALIALGVRQETLNPIEYDFCNAMGFMCVTFSMLLTNKQVSEDWQFTQHGLLYVENDQERIMVRQRSGEGVSLSNAEFCVCVAVMACQENMVRTLREGFKNPFRMSYFYQNYIMRCAKELPLKYLSFETVQNFIRENASGEYKLLEPKIHELLEIEVGSA